MWQGILKSYLQLRDTRFLLLNEGLHFLSQIVSVALSDSAIHRPAGRPVKLSTS